MHYISRNTIIQFDGILSDFIVHGAGAMKLPKRREEWWHT